MATRSLISCQAQQCLIVYPKLQAISNFVGSECAQQRTWLVQVTGGRLQSVSLQEAKPAISSGGLPFSHANAYLHLHEAGEFILRINTADGGDGA